MKKRSRRAFLGGMGIGMASIVTPRLTAKTLLVTPGQAEGPFYPDVIPRDTDNDLLIIGNRRQALGEITHLRGSVRDTRGNPVAEALVEIWQVDGNGVYLHSSAAKTSQDRNFQGYGRFVTGADGQYSFRTVKPVAYPGRAPHIHLIVSNKHSKRILTTQCYVAGDSRNASDSLYRSLGKRQSLVTIPFVPIKNSPSHELQAWWDIIVYPQ